MSRSTSDRPVRASPEAKAETRTRYKIRGFIGVKSNDGHDAPILVVADAMKRAGLEVILGGYDLTVDKFVDAIIQEGVQFAGISSYNGGHLSFFQSVRDQLQKRHYPWIHLLGGGGATITAEDIRWLEGQPGIDKIFRSGEGPQAPEFVKRHYDFSPVPDHPEDWLDGVREGDPLALSLWINLAEEKARLQTLVERGPGEPAAAGFPAGPAPVERTGEAAETEAVQEQIRRYDAALGRLDSLAARSAATATGLSGRGGSGKSTLTDELVLRFFQDPRLATRKLALVSVDPSSPFHGGALLADRIAYVYATDKHWVDPGRIFIRSVAARGFGHGIARALPDILKILKAAGYDLLVESYGTGQPDAGLVPWVDRFVFVTTADLGGATQMAKEEGLNRPGAYVVLNKNDLPGARRVLSLLRGRIPEERLFCTIALEHKNPGVDRLYQALTAHYG